MKGVRPRKPTIRERLGLVAHQLRTQGLRSVVFEFIDVNSRVFLGASAPRFSRITPELYVGGQHNKLTRLLQQGITAVVSLRDEFDDHERGLAPQIYLYLPTVDDTPPTLEYLQRGVDFIQQHIQHGEHVYIHCWHGVGRAPTLTAAYLVSTGLTPAQAWKRISTVRPFIRPTQQQQQQVEAFAANLAHMAG